MLYNYSPFTVIYSILARRHEYITISYFVFPADRLLEWCRQTGADPGLSTASKWHFWHGESHCCSYYHHGKRLLACARQHTLTHAVICLAICNARRLYYLVLLQTILNITLTGYAASGAWGSVATHHTSYLQHQSLTLKCGGQLHCYPLPPFPCKAPYFF